MNRRAFLKGAVLAAGMLVGPWSLGSRAATAATLSTPALEFLTPTEYQTIRGWALALLADEPVQKGLVDVALNVDRFLARNPSPDFLLMLRYVRLIRLAEPLRPLLGRGIGADMLSFKRMLIYLGYYSDANGEAELPPEERRIWTRIGYGGPKPDGWYPPATEPVLAAEQLPDRIKEGR